MPVLSASSVNAFCAMLWLLVTLAWLYSLRRETDYGALQKKVSRLSVWLCFVLGEIALFALGQPLPAVAVFGVLAMFGIREVWNISKSLVPAAFGVLLTVLLVVVSPAQLLWMLAGSVVGLFCLPYSKGAVVRWAAASLIGVYVALLPLSVYAARDVPQLLAVVLFALTASHLVDIGSGFWGKLGRARPLKVLSPNKTVLGFLVGALVATAVVGAMHWWIFGRLLDARILIGGVAVWAATAIGDLVGSKVKRIFAVKDFGAALGPHGGMMDRLDAIVPVVVISALWFAPSLSMIRIGYSP